SPLINTIVYIIIFQTTGFSSGVPAGPETAPQRRSPGPGALWLYTYTIRANAGKVGMKEE
ncbi:hypothetical protein CFSAN000599_27370, partial [Salmonella enterica subsp. enterica serovar Newport str. CFSAN000599]|nr:hypothetical protein [Salmonella enterica subsp. enterica serovar Newport str. CFSAN000599]